MLNVARPGGRHVEPYGSNSAAVVDGWSVSRRTGKRHQFSPEYVECKARRFSDDGPSTLSRRQQSFFHPNSP
jgi:hypothetical protein